MFSLQSRRFFMAYFLTWHGHANFEITTPTQTIFIDPWFSGNPKADMAAQEVSKADLILLTHDHDDHLGDALDLCMRTRARLVAQVELANALMNKGLDQDLVVNGIGFNIGGTVDVQGTRITMTQAFHSCGAGTPVGFIIQLDNGFTLYHAGDTGIFGDMKIWGELYPLDLALLPTGDVFTMDARQAAKACSLLQCRQAVPMHWGTFPSLDSNPATFEEQVRQLAPSTRAIIMQPGENIELVP
jgi:L-ascorbate metabolism protein UlaG (beta-lactamase superfamily)